MDFVFLFQNEIQQEYDRKHPYYDWVAVYRTVLPTPLFLGGTAFIIMTIIYSVIRYGCPLGHLACGIIQIVLWFIFLASVTTGSINFDQGIVKFKSSPIQFTIWLMIFLTISIGIMVGNVTGKIDYSNFQKKAPAEEVPGKTK